LVPAVLPRFHSQRSITMLPDCVGVKNLRELPTACD
jgi:hypothetical protein